MPRPAHTRPPDFAATAAEAEIGSPRVSLASPGALGAPPPHRRSPSMNVPGAFLRLAAVAAGLALAAPAAAAPKITVSIAQLKEVAEQQGGERKTKLVPATSV